MALEKGLPDLSSIECWQQFLSEKIKLQTDEADHLAYKLQSNGATKDAL